MPAGTSCSQSLSAEVIVGTCKAGVTLVTDGASLLGTWRQWPPKASGGECAAKQWSLGVHFRVERP